MGNICFTTNIKTPLKPSSKLQCNGCSGRFNEVKGTLISVSERGTNDNPIGRNKGQGSTYEPGVAQAVSRGPTFRSCFYCANLLFDPFQMIRKLLSFLKHRLVAKIRGRLKRGIRPNSKVLTSLYQSVVISSRSSVLH